MELVPRLCYDAVIIFFHPEVMPMMPIVGIVFLLIHFTDQKPDDKIFSGPQVGEKTAPFKMRGVFGDDAGKELDVVTKAGGKPTVLLFVHDANRPSIGFMRILMNYIGEQAKKDLNGAIVWLAADVSEAEAALKRMSQALPKNVPIGISTDGKEGPGTYGLNRNVTLTVLIVKDNKVTANFALVQPSIQADLPKVLEQVAKVIGEKPPKLEDVPGVKEIIRNQSDRDEKLTGMIRMLIRKDASEEAVNKTAGEIETYIKANARAKQEVGRIAKTLVDGGKLSDYGTPKAQEYLRKWAKELGSQSKESEKKK